MGYHEPQPTRVRAPIQHRGCRRSYTPPVRRPREPRACALRLHRDREELKAGGSFYTLCMQFSGNELVALLIAVSFAAGLNVYATVATLGLLAHTRWLELPASLHILSDWRIIAAALALFAVEFFADKVPAFDLVWNALHTFIRI